MKFNKQHSLQTIVTIIILTLELILTTAGHAAPFPNPPVWGEAEIRASHIVYPLDSAQHLTPVFNADPMNLFMVIESGDHHITLLDGDKFEPIHRFPYHYALYGKPTYSSNGRYVYFTSHVGRISKFDIYSLKITAEIKVGISVRNTALSNDNKYLIVANDSPHTLVVLNADDLTLNRIIPVKTGKNKSSPVTAVYNAAPRNTFVATLKDSPEIWEISYETPPPPGFGHWTHDYREDSGDIIKDMFPVRKIKLKSALKDFFFHRDYVHVLGTSSNGDTRVIDLDLGRQITVLKLPGLPHLSSGITWKYKDTEILATPNQKDGSISIIDTQTWQLIKTIKTSGAGILLHSHKNSPYVWTDNLPGDDRDIINIIDKQTLKIIKTLRPESGKQAAHIEFTKDGSHALISIQEMDGALIIYDAKTLKVVKRLPMKQPVGKYNVYNTITLSSGTSH